MLKHQGLWLAGGWLLVMLVVSMSLIPHPSEPLAFKHADKLEHAFSYGMLSLWFCQIYKSARSRLIVMAALVGLGVGLEFVQGWTGYRFYDVLDMLANSVGVLLGWLLSRSPLGHAFIYIERRLG